MMLWSTAFAFALAITLPVTYSHYIQQLSSNMHPTRFILFLLLQALQTVFASVSEQVVMDHSQISVQNDESTTNSPSLADLLTIENTVSIFYSYARELSLSQLLEDPNSYITLFAPTNPAVMALARKPHQGPAPVDDMKISQEEYDKLSRKNVENWVSSHIVPYQVSLTPNDTYKTMHDCVKVNVTSMKGGPENPDWTHVHLNGKISLTKKAEAYNGVLYLIDGTLFG